MPRCVCVHECVQNLSEMCLRDVCVVRKHDRMSYPDASVYVITSLCVCTVCSTVELYGQQAAVYFELSVI